MFFYERCDEIVVGEAANMQGPKRPMFSGPMRRQQQQQQSVDGDDDDDDD